MIKFKVDQKIPFQCNRDKSKMQPIFLAKILTELHINYLQLMDSGVWWCQNSKSFG